jgi:hypothetical protein
MSHLEDIVTDVAARYADSTVSFEAGKLVLNKHAQKRKIILVRESGDARFSKAPNKVAFGVPVGGAGTVTQQRFERFERIECTLRAEDEDALDAMFDRFINTVFEVFGPNAFEESNAYQWFQGDSTNGGDWARRNPAIKLYINVRLKSRSQPGPYAVLGSAEATLILKDSEGATGATADFVTIVTPP